ncbi:MAG: GTPase HflX [Actinomycetaceae bacterium]|nr:GTPase HflX [Actinomycetaceae bacterium]
MSAENDSERAQDVVRRILERETSTQPASKHNKRPQQPLGDYNRRQASSSQPLFSSAQALLSTQRATRKVTGGELEREARAALTRIQSLRSDREDISEVEYRQIRLERVVLVGLWDKDYSAAVNSLQELAALAKTAGSYVVEGVLQHRTMPSASTYVGRGKAQEIARIVSEGNADTVIVDDELSPSQRRGLEDVVDAKVVDRTALILDIFAQHATSREGKAQVELAQLRYLLPRLRGWGESMSRQAGGRVSGGAGIGSRGPGETKIELDRRRISQRVAKLRRDIKAMGKTRAMKRGRRKAHRIPSVAIVGYTNAGKSSLMNRLTDADVLVQDSLFATLDPTVRQNHTEDGREYTLTDTVGFVSRLPHELIEAFRSTLEEVEQADLIVHVVDAAHPDPDGQVKAVREVIADLDGAEAIPEILVFNKADLAQPARVAMLRSSYDDALIVSAYSGRGIAELEQRIAQLLPKPSIFVDVIVPYDKGALISQMHEEGQIDSIEYLEIGTHVVGRARSDLAARLQRVDAVQVPE